MDHTHGPKMIMNLLPLILVIQKIVNELKIKISEQRCLVLAHGL